MPAPPLLQLRDISLSFGGRPLLDGAAMSVSPGDRLCLVGRNGSGKSTLMRIAAGLIEADSGERFISPSATIRYLPQEPDFSGFATTLAFVEAGLAPGDDTHRARFLLESLGLTGEENPATISGGEGRRAALARALAPEPDILLLDEPTNHLDIPAIEALEKELRGLRSALVIISHDRRFLDNLSTSTLWLDRGMTRLLDKGFGAFEAWRDQVLEEEELEQHKLDRKIVMEEHWLRYGVTARRKRNQNRLARLRDLRSQRREARGNRPLGDVAMAAQEARQSGKLVIEAERIARSFGERVIVGDFSTRIERGDRVGLVGPNGAGKTTLLNLLTGALAPDGGSVRLGANVAMATLDQARTSLKPDTTLADVLTGGRGDSVVINGQSRHVVGYMKDFLFRPEQARTPVKALSGGERGRLMLARALSLPSNLLVLDEPTNDLDLETLDLLQEMLASYEGTLLLVSHDRDFLDRIVTSVVAYDRPGQWIEYAGGYSDMVAQRGAGVLAREDERPSPPARAEPARTSASRAPARKLGFNEQHALKTLPGTIARLEKEIAAAEASLADPGAYDRDPAGFAALTRQLHDKHTAREAAEEEWLRLEMLREEIEGG
jgi:ATP-binding cassette subfamily F protein uup